MDYNTTLNLPKTDFPMKANLPMREPAFLEAWQQKKIYEKLLEKNADRPLYILHDGPPFSNGSIHMGTALNKVLKDFIVRYKSMSGYRVPYVPGWDNHGMPIESAIIKKNKLNRKRMSIPEFRNACQKFAEDFVEIQKGQFVRLGVLGDWEHPYHTMDRDFEATEIKVFGEMYRKGYIYKGLKPVYWCPTDETALAEAEIEYKDIPCTSVYVKFRVSDDKGLLAPYGDLSKMYFVIWTTTIWTLPGNVAIAVAPEEKYVLVKVPDGEMYVLADALADRVMQVAGISEYERVAEFKGRDLEFVQTQHPFLDRPSTVLLADYVTMDSGTGCVHTAPGFGADDYQTCRRYKMDLIVPVDDRGYQTEDAGPYAGLKYDESNTVILKDLKESGALLASENVQHSYPHCWRCKNPIIFRATPQWFCSVEAFKEQAKEAARGVKWMPEWGGDRMLSMIEERADWCISRQRHWGLPIPVFYCEDCGKPICTTDTINTVSELFGKEGSNCWYEKDAAELLPDGFVCPHCGGKHFTKETDTLDGWFDSGSTHFVVLDGREGMRWPADLYLEGADQYRGWFQSSLLTAVGVKGEAPYRAVLTHGWTVDGEGRAMHKSLGNAMAPEEIVNKYGADLLRLWVASSDYKVDVRVSDAIFKQLSQAYLKIRNTAKYILGNLDGFDPDMPVSPEEMTVTDRWAITRVNDLIRRVTDAYENFEYHVVYHVIRNFCVVDMSNFYLDAVKDTLYCEEKNGLLRRSVQTAMYFILDALVRMLAPILCFTADEIWTAMPHRRGDDAENVMFNPMVKPWDAYSLDEKTLAEMNRLIELRDVVNASLEEARNNKLIGKSLEADVILTCSDEDFAVLDKYKEKLPMLLIVSGVELEKGETLSVRVEKASGQKCERCWQYCQTVGSDPEHPTLCERCAHVVRSL